jgi:hypothetical protein
VRHGVAGETGDCAADTLWNSVEVDCQFLIDHAEGNSARALATQPFWDFPSEQWDDDNLLLQFTQRLVSIDYNYKVWIDWYERRIRGERAAFDIPGDKGRVEDKKILRRLAEATDQDFWGKGHEYVNATLKGWLDEARARVAPAEAKEDVKDIRNFSGVSGGGGSVFANSDEVLPVVPPQNRNALSFRTDEDGRITIDASASVDQLRTDAEARDRHSEAASEANAVLDRCRSNNAAARLTLRLENYLAAIGPSIEDTKPSLLVQRGEKLRQELAAYAAPDTLLYPIAEDILVDLKGWQSSHNIMVGLDPVLMAIDTAMLGPDRRPALIPPDEIKQFARDAQEADLLAEGTEEIIIEAADLAPTLRTEGPISAEKWSKICASKLSALLSITQLGLASLSPSALQQVRIWLQEQ